MALCKTEWSLGVMATEKKIMVSFEIHVKWDNNNGMLCFGKLFILWKKRKNILFSFDHVTLLVTFYHTMITFDVPEEEAF